MTIRSGLTAALCLGVLLLPRCAVNPVSGRPEVTLVSAEQERELGEEEAKKVEAQMGFADDSHFGPYLDELGQRLAAESPRKDVAWRFHIVDMDEPNAFALPGGHIYVSRGLLALSNSEDELACVVGHEIGHVAAKHTVQRISRQGPLAVVFGLASGITGLVSPLLGNIIGGIGDITQSAIFSPYSRSQENEADRVGQEIAARAGWDPAGLPAFLSTLEKDVELHQKEPRKPSFFDSHPATSDRVENTQKHAAELLRTRRAPISPSRQAYLSRLEGIVSGPRAANGIFRKSRFLHPDLGFTLEFPEEWPHDNSPQQILAAAPDGKAAIVVGVVAKGSDPLEGARAAGRASQADFASQAKRTTIHGLPAAGLQLEGEGRARADVTWIAHAGLVYQIAGLADASQFSTLLPLFRSASGSFRSLSAEERAGITEARIRLVKARAGETPAALVERSGSAWKKEEVAVANGLALDAALEAGQPVKVAVSERYAGASGR